MRKSLTILLSLLLVFCAGSVCFAADGSEALRAADRLYAMGLFGGTGANEDGTPIYSLERQLNRQEAITMILNLLGEAHAAQQQVHAHPFEDVDAWAVPYVSYAYAKGITAGFSAESFGAHREVTASEYLTFLLLCLSYEQGADFSWDRATLQTDWIGITRGEYADNQTLTRGDAVIVSERALHAFCKDSSKTLAESIQGVALDEPLALSPRVLQHASAFCMEDVPPYSGSPFAVLNAGIPFFCEYELSHLSFERYGELDSLGRCSAAFACLHKDLMPTDARTSIGQIKPSGWKTVRYDDLIADKYLYNRSHLIAFSLAGEGANERNLITGTNYMNQDGMRAFETRVANYLRHSDHHVLYRATPIFEGDNLVASGVHLEAMSVEDGGEGLMLNVFLYNVQPGIEIDYRTGDSKALPNAVEIVAEHDASAADAAYVANTRTGKFHLLSCSAVEAMSELNKYYCNDRDELIELFVPCKLCNP